MCRPEYEGGIALIDRHYSSLRPYDPERPNLYAVGDGNRVALRYIERVENHLVIRAANIEFPTKLIEIAPDVNPGDYTAGRVAIIQHDP